jgi:hypothetical protein
VKYLQVTFEERPLESWDVRYAKEFKNLKQVFLLNGGFDRTDMWHIYDMYRTTMEFLAKVFPKNIEYFLSTATTQIPHAEYLLLDAAPTLKFLNIKGSMAVNGKVLEKLGKNLVQLKLENTMSIEAQDWVNFAKRAQNLREFEFNDLTYDRKPMPAEFWQNLPKEMTALKASENKNLKPTVLSTFKKLIAVKLSQEMLLRKQIQTKLAKRLKDLDVFDIDSQKIKQLGIVFKGLKLLRLGLSGKFTTRALVSLISNIPDTVEELDLNIMFPTGNEGNEGEVAASKLVIKSLKKVNFRLQNIDTSTAELLVKFGRANPTAGGVLSISRYFQGHQDFPSRMGQNYLIKWQ